MVHHYNIIRGKVHIEFTTPETVLLGRAQRSNGILRIPRLLTLPVSPVGTDFLRLEGETAQQKGGQKQEYMLLERVHLTKIDKKKKPDSPSGFFLVGMTRLERATPTSRT